MFVAIESMVRVLTEERKRAANGGSGALAEWCALEWRQVRRHG